jgi:hypothetical protein
MNTLLYRTEQLAVSDLFQQPFANNTSNVYLKKQTDREHYFVRLNKLYAELNRADLNLKNFIQQLNIEKFKLGEIDEVLAQWDTFIQKNVNLVGVFYVKSIIEKFNANDIDIVGHISDIKKELLLDFISIPEETKSLLRINICAPYENTTHYFEQLVNEVFSNEAAFSLLERVEIARPRIPGAFVNYPTLILYLNPNDGNKTGSTEIKMMSNLLNATFDNVKNPLEIAHDYADPWNHFVNITQGFKLYKVYLQLLEQLDQVYAKEFNYAYLLNSPDQVFANELKGLSD